MDSYSASLLILGIVFVFIEFFIPGGILGFIGFVFFAIGVYLKTNNLFYTLFIFFIAFAIFLLLMFLAIKIFKKENNNTLFLETDLNDSNGFLSSKENNEFRDCIMETKTFLRPSGKVIYKDTTFDAITNGEFVEKGKKVKVIGNKGYVLIVKEIM